MSRLMAREPATGPASNPASNPAKRAGRGLRLGIGRRRHVRFYSRIVAWMKVLLPLAAVAVISALFLSAQKESNLSDIFTAEELLTLGAGLRLDSVDLEAGSAEECEVAVCERAGGDLWAVGSVHDHLTHRPRTRHERGDSSCMARVEGLGVVLFADRDRVEIRPELQTHALDGKIGERIRSNAKSGLITTSSMVPLL